MGGGGGSPQGDCVDDAFEPFFRFVLLCGELVHGQHAGFVAFEGFAQVLVFLGESLVLLGRLVESRLQGEVLLLQVGGSQGDLVLLETPGFARSTRRHVVLLPALPILVILVIRLDVRLLSLSDDWLWSEFVWRKVSPFGIEVSSLS